MGSKSIFIRSVVPAAIMLLVMIVLFFVYNNSMKIENRLLSDIVANVSAIAYFLSVCFGIFWIYPRGWFGGAPASERIGFSLINPIVWAIKEAVRVGSVFGFAQGLYFMLSPLNIGMYCFAALFMGIAELACRSKARRSGDQDIKTLTPGPVLAIGVSVLLVGIIFLWGLGVHSFYIFQQGYKAIFH